jgi:flagellar motor switch protein FliN
MAKNEPQSGVDAGAAALLGNDQSAYPNLDPPPLASELAAETGEPAGGSGLDFVLDVPVRLSVELGRTQIPIRDVVNISRGAIIELDGAPGASLDVRVNGVLIGRGEVVVIDEERLGLRFVEVVSQAERAGRPR